ncbi:MAG TPA: hypothetical protein VMI73_06680 [Trebonia sp.]|nr:hypothetical protein [Trebonia sp.]
MKIDRDIQRHVATGKVAHGAAAASHQRYFVRSNGWAGGDKIVHPSKAPTANQCVPQQAGSSFKTKNERAVNWSAGFSIPVLGFNAQAQTGYDTSAQISLAFGATGRLCGTNDYPAAQVSAYLKWSERVKAAGARIPHGETISITLGIEPTTTTGSSTSDVEVLYHDGDSRFELLTNLGLKIKVPPARCS